MVRDWGALLTQMMFQSVKPSFNLTVPQNFNVNGQLFPAVCGRAPASRPRAQVPGSGRDGCVMKWPPAKS